MTQADDYPLKQLQMSHSPSPKHSFVFMPTERVGVPDGGDLVLERASTLSSTNIKLLKAGGDVPESLACCDLDWMLYMASYICGRSSSCSLRASLEKTHNVS